ncbi:hypothetical protein HDU91_001276, partial [Kappamyces sp. JEL0680]
ILSTLLTVIPGRVVLPLLIEDTSADTFAPVPSDADADAVYDSHSRLIANYVGLLPKAAHSSNLDAYLSDAITSISLKSIAAVAPSSDGHGPKAPGNSSVALIKKDGLLNKLFSKLDGFFSHSMAINIALTGVFSQLASQPSPVLTAALFDDQLDGPCIYTSVYRLQQELDKLKSTIPNFEVRVMMARQKLLSDASGPLRTDEYNVEGEIAKNVICLEEFLKEIKPGFGFGSAAPASTPQSTTFGAPATTPSSGGFGANPAAASTFGAPSSTGFGFGANKPPALSLSTNNASGGFGAGAATGSVFGQSAAPPTASGGLFGQPAQGTAGGLFGQQQTQGTGLFGSTNAATAGFGQQPQQSSLFGGTTGTAFGQQPSSFGGFGQTQSAAPPTMQPQQPQALDYIKYVAGCWDPKNPACQFKYYFYNMVHPSEVSLYQPAQGEDRVLYEQAQMDNPDPSCMVPVLAVGFEGLKTRLEIQDAQLKIHKEKIQEFKSRLEKVERAHTVETIVKIEQYKRKQSQIAHKILQLMKAVQILRNKGYSLRAEEEAFMTRLISMDRDLAKPSVFRGRINEIYAHVQQQKDANRLVLGAYGSSSGDEGFTLADPEALKPVIQALEEIGKGLAQLTQVINEDDATIEKLAKGYQDGALVDRLR